MRELVNNIYKDLVARLGELHLKEQAVLSEVESLKAQIRLLDGILPRLEDKVAQKIKSAEDAVRMEVAKAKEAVEAKLQEEKEALKAKIEKKSTEALVDSGSVSLIVIDSVAALVPQAELDGEMGDSVVYETPVYIRRKGTTNVEIKQVGDLYGGQRTGGTYRKTSRMEVLTHQGWKQLLAVQKKPNIAKKEIVYTRTAQGYIGTTKDHSLFVNGKEASPNELKVFDRPSASTFKPYLNTIKSLHKHTMSCIALKS